MSVEEDKGQTTARNRDNYLNKIRQFIREGKLCEIETMHGTTAVGSIKEISREYLTVIRIETRTITVLETPDISEGEESKKESVKKVPVEYIEEIEFTTVLRLTEITAVSQITKKVVK